MAFNRVVHGNIWKIARRAHDHIVVPTNQGYRRDGTNVMGRGLARQAAEKWPDLPAEYGDFCMKHRETTPLCYIRPKGYNSRNLLLFPVKPFNPNAPHLSWDQPASLELITRSTQQLRDFAAQLNQSRPAAGVYLPLVGCGNGSLEDRVVIPVLERYLDQLSNIVLVMRRTERKQRSDG